MKQMSKKLKRVRLTFKLLKEKIGLFNEVVNSLHKKSRRLGRAKASVSSLKAPCRCFDGYINPSGYGIFSYTNRKLFGNFSFVREAHIVSWMIVNKKEPKKGKVIGHLCQNEWCVEPSHLKEITKPKNSEHALLNRMNVDPANKTWKITTEEVHTIRRLYSEYNYTVEELHNLIFPHISKQTISNIVRRITWKIPER